MDKIQLRAERVVIHSILTMPETIHEIMNRISDDMFVAKQHRTVFRAIVSLYIESEPISIISLHKKISTDYKKDSAAAKSAIVEIVSELSVITTFEIQDAIAHLISSSIRDEQEKVGKEIVKMTSDKDTYNPEDVLGFMQEHIVSNKLKSIGKKKEYTNEEILKELDEQIEAARNSEGVTGIPSGYSKIDGITSGWHGTNFVIVAARPAMGKTQFAIGMAKHASVDNNYKGLFFNCEMSEVQLMKRIIAVDGNIKGYSMKYGNMSREETLSYFDSRDRILESNLKLRAGSFTVTDIISEIHRERNANGLDYVIVDYLQKVRFPDAQNRNNEVEEVSARLKDVANELGIPIIALAQLSRSVEHRPDKKPMLSDLRDSGAIEQDADIVIFLYRPSYYMSEEEKAEHPLSGFGYAMIAKHRDGGLGDVELRFEEEIPAWLNTGDGNPVPVYRGGFSEEIEFEEEPTKAIQPNKDFDDLPF